VPVDGVESEKADKLLQEGVRGGELELPVDYLEDLELGLLELALRVRLRAHVSELGKVEHFGLDKLGRNVDTNERSHFNIITRHAVRLGGISVEICHGEARGDGLQLELIAHL